MNAQRFAITAVLLLALLAPGMALDEPVAPPVAAESQASSDSMLIVENAGQWPEAALFQVWGSPLGAGMTWLAEDAIWVTVFDQGEKESGRRDDGDPFTLSAHHVFTPTSQSGVNLKLTFPGSNPDVRIEPFAPLTTTISYFIGNDPERWRPAVPVWGGVRYVDLYPGIDLIIGSRGNFWQIEALPDASVDDVRVQVEGADLTAIDELTLELHVDRTVLPITLPMAPFDYQATWTSDQGEPLDWPVFSVLRATAGPDDDSADLLYSTFLGGSNSDWGRAIAVDRMGSAYMAGFTYSTGFPTTPGSFSPSHNGEMDVFVVKLRPTGSGLEYATFLGGRLWDYGFALALDETGSAYVTGTTYSTDFPTTPGAFDTNFNGSSNYGGDAFIVKLNPAGSGLVYATFLGGWTADDGEAIVVDDDNQVVVTGKTGSSNFPTTPGAFDTQCDSTQCSDAFITKLNQNGSGLIYSTFLGGDGTEGGQGIDVDGTSSVYVTGFTTSVGFPTTLNAFDVSHNGNSDAFVVKLNPTGSELVYATFLGGSEHDHGHAISVDEAGNASATGQTRSSNFPTTPDAFDTDFNGGTCNDGPCPDAFVLKLNASGTGLVYATFVGGGDADQGNAIDLDSSGNVFITGVSSSLNFPTTPGAYDTSFNSIRDAFVAKLSPSGRHLAYATFLGGSDSDGGYAIAADEMGNAYVFGDTFSSDFPTTPDAFDASYNGSGSGGGDTFLTKLDLAPYVPNVLARIGQPSAGSFVSGTVSLRGFAIDLNSSKGTGVDRVSMYLDGPYGTGTHIGDPTYGLDRPDIAAQYGARFAPSGWELAWDTAGVPPGVHQIYLYAHRSTDNAWSVMPPHLVVMRGGQIYWLPIMLHS